MFGYSPVVHWRSSEKQFGHVSETCEKFLHGQRDAIVLLHT